jgi:hypothetical protein
LDNDAEWLSLSPVNGRQGIAGFTAITATPSSLLYDAYTGQFYNVYHTVWLSPRTFNAFRNYIADGISLTDNAFEVATALMVLDHEAQHWRLFSGDESRVNACALADMPRLLQADFGIPATITQTVSVPITYKVKVRYRVRVKVKGRYVYRYRYRYVNRVRYENQQQQFPNPLYTTILSAARDSYNSQPPPYNSGTC